MERTEREGKGVSKQGTGKASPLYNAAVFDRDAQI